MPVRGGGFTQGYNAQNVTSEDGLVIATRLTDDPADTCWYQPVISAAARAAAGQDGKEEEGGGGDEAPVAKMTARLATAEGIAAYRMRGHIAETPHGNIKHNPPPVRARHPQGIRRVDLRLRRPQPHQGHHRQPPHPPGPRRPRRLTPQHSPAAREGQPGSPPGT
jgi:hypothetical protein